MSRLLAITSLAAVAAGAAVLALGLRARSDLDPTEVAWGRARFAIERHELGQVVEFRFVGSDGALAATLAGSTDLLCDAPRLMRLDVDGDGEREVYYRTCGGHGYLEFEPRDGTLREVALGQFDPDDAPGLRGPWADEVGRGGLGLLAGGGVLLLLGVGLGIAAGVARVVRREGLERSPGASLP